MTKTDHRFTTTDEKGTLKTWKFWRPKDSGANSAGELGGFYENEASGQKAMVKADPRPALNIAEFLAGQICQKLIPDASARINFAKVDNSQGPSEDGKNVYVVSEFISGWQGTLYEDIKKTLGENPEISKNMGIESAQILTTFMRRGALTKAFDIQNQAGNNLNFGEVQATNLLINNIDTHLNNIGPIKGADGKHRLGTIDYGAAFNDVKSAVKPHGIIDKLLSHAVHAQGWNNLIFYPENQKINARFVAELDKVAKTDLSDTYSKGFKTISEYYGPKPIEEFALRTGLMDKATIKSLQKLYQNRPEYPDPDQYKNKLLENLEKRMNIAMKARQQDLARFSAQIKADLCVGVKDNKLTLDNSFIDATTGKKTAFRDVVLAHHDYFREVLSGEKEFKFRAKVNKKAGSKLIQQAKNEAGYVFANLIIKDKDICKKYNINTVDQAYEAVQKGTLRGQELSEALKKAEKLPEATKNVQLDSLIGLAKDGALNKENREIIKALIENGSNVNLKMPDGSKLIDHAIDIETKMLLVHKGANLTSNVMKHSDIAEQKDLTEAREAYLKKNGKIVFPHWPFDKKLVDQTNSLKYLSEAIRLGKETSIEAVLNQKLDFKNVKVSMENNPLAILASRMEKEDNLGKVTSIMQDKIVNTLAKSGFDFGAEDKDGNTVMHKLIEKHSALKKSTQKSDQELIKKVDSLISDVLFHCDKNSIEKAGGESKVTPLTLAVLNDDKDMAKKLLDAGANPKVKFHKEDLAQIAFKAGNYSLTVYLLEAGGTAKNIKLKPSQVSQLLDSKDRNKKNIGEKILEAQYSFPQNFTRELAREFNENLKAKDMLLAKAVKEDNISLLNSGKDNKIMELNPNKSTSKALEGFDIGALQKAIKGKPENNVTKAIKQEIKNITSDKGWIK